MNLSATIIAVVAAISFIPHNSSAYNISVVHGSRLAAQVSEAELLKAARAWWAERGFGTTRIEKVGRLLYFEDRKEACFAVGFPISATDQAGKAFTYEFWLWFDRAGRIVNDADSAVFESTIIPGSPR